MIIPFCTVISQHVYISSGTIPFLESKLKSEKHVWKIYHYHNYSVSNRSKKCKKAGFAKHSDRENYFWHAGQYVRQAFSALPDILDPCQTFSQLMTGNYQWSFLFSLSDILHGLNPAGQNVRQCLSSLPVISRSLPDMSGIFRDHWKQKLASAHVWSRFQL